MAAELEKFFFWCIIASACFGVHYIQVFAASNSVNLEVLEVLNIENLNVASIDNLDNSNSSNEFIFSDCLPGQESCQECYLTLVKSLLGNDKNVVNLSKTFTSPIHDEPNSVVVKYHFINNSVDHIVTWFWARSGAYFLHPLSVFQFISLAFGNPRPLYEIEVDLYLDATECYGVQNNHDYMTLLTQRVSWCDLYLYCNCEMMHGY